MSRDFTIVSRLEERVARVNWDESSSEVSRQIEPSKLLRAGGGWNRLAIGVFMPKLN